MSERGIGRAKQVRNVARVLWMRLCERYDAYRRRRAAAALYTALSRLSDAELARRGLSRHDLHHLVREMDERK